MKPTLPLVPAGGATPLRWLELAPGYACNCRCLGCHACSADPHDQMGSAEVLEWLKRGRREGARHLWLSGGEPTLRRDFLGTLKAARQLGYQRIKVQTNGMRLAYPDFAAAAVAAGMNEVNLLLKSLDAARHDELNATPGAHALLEQALDGLRQHPLRLEGDVLVTTRNLDELPELVAHYAGRGLSHFNVWLFSLADAAPGHALSELVPPLGALGRAVTEAWRAARAAGATLCSLHTPPCVLPPEAWEALFDAAGMGLLVVNPGGNSFRLETSVFEQGSYPPPCTTCAARPACRGVRADTLALHGHGDLAPVSPEALARGDVRGSRLEIEPGR